MIELKAKNEAEAKKEAVKISLENPGSYVTVFACFGLCVTISKRLHVFAPSDSIFSWYVRNGKTKTFTEKQTIQDQINTPTMS